MRQYGNGAGLEEFAITSPSGETILSHKGSSYWSNKKITFSICVSSGSKYTVRTYSSASNSWDSSSYLFFYYGNTHLFEFRKGYYYATFYFSINKCQPNEIPIGINRRYGSYYGYKESFSISQSGKTIVSASGTSSDRYTTYGYGRCIKPRISCTLSTYSSSGKWESSSGLFVYYNASHLVSYSEYFSSQYFSVNPNCVSNGIWPSTYVLTNATKACESDDYEGQRTRYCGIENGQPVWEDPVNNCIPKPPVINYLENSYVFQKYATITNIIPDTQRIIDSISIAPPLPEGLSLNTTTGSITGSPLVVSPLTEYNITASNSAHNTTTTIQIEVNPIYCPIDGEWNETEVDLKATLPCETDDYDGQRTRLCSYINNTATWEDVIRECIPKAPVISYPEPSYTFTKYDPISDVIPTTQYIIDSFSITPALPMGLTLDAVTGRITGTSIDPSPATEYTITASNSAHSVNTTITITVEDVSCPSGYIPTFFVRSAPQTEMYQCFSLVSTNLETPVQHGDCPENGVEGVYSDWFNMNNQLFFYKCLPPATYQLHLTSFTLEDPSVHAGSWTNNNFISLISLPYVDGEGNEVPEREIGDFTYTQLCNAEGTTEYENIAFINVGPINCKDDEQIVIFEQFSTYDANLEGFDLYHVENDQSTYLASFYGQVTFNSASADPYAKYALCLPLADYKVVLRQKSTLNESTCQQCSGWSTVNSNNEVEYTDLAGNKSSKQHPSFMKITTLSSKTYNYESDLDAKTIVEGENLAVFGADRTHISTPYSLDIPETDIYSLTDCHYDVLFSIKPATFNIENENTSYTEGTLLTVGVGITSSIDVKCEQDPLKGTCHAILDYTVQCYLTFDNAQRGVDAVDCKAYGLIYTASVISSSRRLEDESQVANRITFTGVYTTPNAMRANLYVKISSVVDEEQGAYIPSTQIVNLAIEPSVDPNNKYFYGPQNESICIVGERSLVATCNLKSLDLPQGAFTISTNDECSGVAMNFAIGNVIPFNCTFDNGHEYYVYVKPLHDHSNILLHMSISETDTIYEEPCTESKSEEVYYAYDVFTMNIEQVQHVTACHQNIFNSIQNRPPRGHSYISVIFDVASNSTEDSNAAPSTTWFKQEFVYALSEVSHVPIRDVYILSIVYHSETMSNTVTVIFDTTSSSGRDFMLQFTEQSDLVFDFISEINSKLDIIYPVYWSVHDLEVDSYDIEVYDNYCTTHIDSSIEFNYLAESGETETQVMNDVTFESTIIWYYSYAQSAADSSQFTGAITRYCKPKYYEAAFDDYTTNTQAQLINTPWEDLHFALLIEKQNPRGANIDVRYAVARSVAALLLHNDTNSDNYIEVYDVNVYMVEGDAPGSPEAVEGDDDYKLYQNTKFYIEVRMRDETQKSRLIEHLNAHIITDSTTGEIDGDVEYAFFQRVKSVLGEGFTYENKSVKIFL